MLTLYHCSNWQEVDLFLRDFRRCIPVVWELLAYTDASFWSLREGTWDNTLNHSRPCSKHLPAKLFGGEKQLTRIQAQYVRLCSGLVYILVKYVGLYTVGTNQ